MKASTKFARPLLVLASIAWLALAEGCMLSNFMHPDNGVHEYSSTGKPTKSTAKKTSWLDKLNLDNLRDARAVEVDRHMASGF